MALLRISEANGVTTCIRRMLYFGMIKAPMKQTTHHCPATGVLTSITPVKHIGNFGDEGECEDVKTDCEDVKSD